MTFEAKIDRILDRMESKVNELVNKFLEKMKGHLGKPEEKEEVRRAFVPFVPFVPLDEEDENANKSENNIDGEIKKDLEETVSKEDIREKIKKKKNFKIQGKKKTNRDTWHRQKRMGAYKLQLQMQDGSARSAGRHFNMFLKLRRGFGLEIKDYG